MPLNPYGDKRQMLTGCIEDDRRECLRLLRFELDIANHCDHAGQQDRIRRALDAAKRYMRLLKEMADA